MYIYININYTFIYMLKSTYFNAIIHVLKSSYYLCLANVEKCKSNGNAF